MLTSCTNPKIRAINPSGVSRFYGSYDHFSRATQKMSTRGYRILELHCGHCIACLSARQDDIGTRVLFEEKTAKEASGGLDSYFLTLTYDDENLPPGGLLYREHLDELMFTLRKFKYFGGLRWYGVGEYGTQSRRAHYHVILFAPKYTGRDSDLFTFSYLGKDASGPFFDCPGITQLWGKGHVYYRFLSNQLAFYMGKYALKDNHSLVYRVSAPISNYDAFSVEDPRYLKLVNDTLSAPSYKGVARLSYDQARDIAKRRWFQEKAMYDAGRYGESSVLFGDGTPIHHGIVGINKSQRRNVQMRDHVRTISHNLYTGKLLPEPLPMTPEFATGSPSLGGEYIKANLETLFSGHKPGYFMIAPEKWALLGRYARKLLKKHGSIELQTQYAAALASSSNKATLQSMLNDGRSSSEIKSVRTQIKKDIRSRDKNKAQFGKNRI